MTMSEIILTAALCVCPLISLFVAIIVARRKKDKDVKKEGEDLGSMKTDLAYIKAGIDDLKDNDKAKDERLDNISRTVAKLEGTLDLHLKDKNAHNYAKKGGHK